MQTDMNTGTQDAELAERGQHEPTRIAAAQDQTEPIQAHPGRVQDTRWKRVRSVLCRAVRLPCGSKGLLYGRVHFFHYPQPYAPLYDCERLIRCITGLLDCPFPAAVVLAAENVDPGPFTLGLHLSIDSLMRRKFDILLHMQLEYLDSAAEILEWPLTILRRATIPLLERECYSRPWFLTALVSLHPITYVVILSVWFRLIY